MQHLTATLIIAGGAGGLVRGLAGYLKHQIAYKNVKFDLTYLLFTILMSSFIGLVVTWAVIESNLSIPALEKVNPAIALIIGYAGGDLIENIYKILVGKATLYPRE